MPAHLEFRDALPKTAVGKLSKKELIEEERQKVQGRRRVNVVIPALVAGIQPCRQLRSQLMAGSRAQARDDSDSARTER